jgi:hypothetical protein
MHSREIVSQEVLLAGNVAELENERLEKDAPSHNLRNYGSFDPQEVIMVRFQYERFAQQLKRELHDRVENGESSLFDSSPP